MIIQRLTPLVNNLMHETLFTKSMLQKENESLSILFLGQAKIQLLPEFKKQHKLYPTQKSNGINLFMYESFTEYLKSQDSHGNLFTYRHYHCSCHMDYTKRKQETQEHQQTAQIQ